MSMEIIDPASPKAIEEAAKLDRDSRSSPQQS
jgi:hypothetical protein